MKVVSTWFRLDPHFAFSFFVFSILFLIGSGLVCPLCIDIIVPKSLFDKLCLVFIVPKRQLGKLCLVFLLSSLRDFDMSSI